jgi:hypothetical protein
VRTVVAPLYYLDHNPELSLLPAEPPTGLVLDPCTQWRERPWQDRSAAFRALPYGNDPEPYDPDHARLGDQELLSLAVQPLDIQRGRGATLLLSTFHIAGLVGTRGRSIELLLAELAIDHFRQQRMDEPPEFAAVGIRRELYATIAVRLGDLASPGSRQALVDAYLGLRPDGLWVKIADLSERSSRRNIRAAGAFLSALREGGIPVVACGPGQLYLALLTDDISASIGIGESERFLRPAPWNPRNKEGAPRGRTRMAYNADLHWSFRVGSKEAKEAFTLAPCLCKEHLRHEPPNGSVVSRHAAILRAQEAGEALNGERLERREWLLAFATRASWKAGDAGMPNKHTASGCYEALFEGLDAGRDAVPGEQAEI